MIKVLFTMLILFTGCSISTTDQSLTSSFGQEYAGTYTITEGVDENSGARWITKNVDTELVAGSKLIIDKAGNITFTKADGSPLTSGFEVMNDGFFGSMAAYYIIIVPGDIAKKGKRFGISCLRGWVSITEITDTKPEGKPDSLFDITKPE